MATRLELSELLHSLCDNVYFQPPASVKMKYPAIRYSRNGIDNNFADDVVYAQTHSYQLIVIDEDPDSEIVMNVSKLPRVRWDRNYVADNLYHDVFTLIF